MPAERRNGQLNTTHWRAALSPHTTMIDFTHAWLSTKQLNRLQVTLAMRLVSRHTPLRILWAETHLMTKKKSETGDLLRDTLDMLILKTLTHGEMHGYDIAEYLHERSDQVLGVEEGALYPALHRLEVRGLLAAEWGMSDNNRRAKYYKLTAAGRKQLTAEAEYWSRMSSAIARILEPA